jgi:hypothetical protein
VDGVRGSNPDTMEPAGRDWFDAIGLGRMPDRLTNSVRINSQIDPRRLTN